MARLRGRRGWIQVAVTLPGRDGLTQTGRPCTRSSLGGQPLTLAPITIIQPQACHEKARPAAPWRRTAVGGDWMVSAPGMRWERGRRGLGVLETAINADSLGFATRCLISPIWLEIGGEGGAYGKTAASFVGGACFLRPAQGLHCIHRKRACR